ncbi:MAG: hypothetical protein WBM99_15945 [Psychromonas sp.]
MGDFTEKIKMRGKAEEDLYFDRLNRQLIEVMHEKMKEKLAQENDKNSKNKNEDLSEEDKSK